MKYLPLLLWPVAFYSMVILARHDPMNTQATLTFLRALTPMITLAVIQIIDTACRTARSGGLLMWTRLAAIPCLFLGMNWLVIYGFTDYRAHLQFTMLCLGAPLTVLGLVFVHWNIFKNEHKQTLTEN